MRLGRRQKMALVALFDGPGEMTAADIAGSINMECGGDLYQLLAKLRKHGLAESRWEAHEIAEAEGRPCRRFYRLTAEGSARACVEACYARDPNGAKSG